MHWFLKFGGGELFGFFLFGSCVFVLLLLCIGRGLSLVVQWIHPVVGVFFSHGECSFSWVQH